MAGCAATAALKAVSLPDESETILPPQQYFSYSSQLSVILCGVQYHLTPMMPHSLMLGLLFLISSRIFGIRSSAFGGAAVVWKNFPSFSSLSLVSGGYHEILPYAHQLPIHAISCQVRDLLGTHVCRRPVEEIRHEDLVLVLVVRVCDDVGTLQRLIEEAEDIVDD